MSKPFYRFLLLALLIAAGAFAQSPTTVSTDSNPLSAQSDVLLDVKKLHVDEISLSIEHLKANINLNARVANLLALTAGVDIDLGTTNLTIKGVDAELTLKVNLTNVASIINDTLNTIDRNPEIITGLLNAVSQVLKETINSAGQLVNRIVDSTGNIVEQVFNTSKQLIDQRVVGNVNSLTKVAETRNSDGTVVRRVVDSSGAVIDVLLSTAGNIIKTTVVSAGL